MSVLANGLETTAAKTQDALQAAIWIRKRGIPAWLMSLLLHFGVFTVLGLVIQVTPRGTPPAGDSLRGGEIVLAARQSDGKTEYYSDADGGNQSASQATSHMPSADASPVSAVPNAPPTSGFQLPAAESAAGSGQPGNAAPGAGELLGSSRGDRRGTELGQKAQTEVFGVQGEGSRFVYVFDRSSSMAGYEGRPLASAKRELISSLEKLEAVHQFQIIFYNQNPRVMRLGGEAGMVFANEEGKQLATDFVKDVVADGGTRHMEALTLALGMRPDVLFFLTDANEPQLLPEELAKIRRLNQGTSINAIEFGAGPPSGNANFLKQLARQNGGNYGYVDVTRLPRG